MLFNGIIHIYKHVIKNKIINNNSDVMYINEYFNILIWFIK